jgi:site-specific recombinase XerD
MIESITPTPVPALPGGSDADRRLVAAFLDQARYVRQVSPYTLRWYRQALANLFAYLADQALPIPGTGAALDEWVAWNAKRGIARPTINSYWRGVRPFFKYLESRCGRPNPYKDAICPDAEREDERVRDALTPDQLALVLDAAEHYPWRSVLERTRAVALVGIMMYGGLRKGEVLRLQFGHVNLATSRILISRGKGRRGGKDRVVYMPAALRLILSEYITARSQYPVIVEGKQQIGFTCAAFFVSSRRNRGLSEVQFRRVIAAIRRASPVSFFPHLLRHSYITMLVTEHFPLQDVQQLAGHSDLKTTALYLHANNDRIRAAVEGIDVRRSQQQ